MVRSHLTITFSCITYCKYQLHRIRVKLSKTELRNLGTCHFWHRWSIRFIFFFSYKLSNIEFSVLYKGMTRKEERGLGLFMLCLYGWSCIFSSGYRSRKTYSVWFGADCTEHYCCWQVLNLEQSREEGIAEILFHILLLQSYRANKQIWRLYSFFRLVSVWMSFMKFCWTFFPSGCSAILIMFTVTICFFPPYSSHTAAMHW